MTCCSLSISTSTATTRLDSAASRRTSASTESVIMRSARPPISATSRVNSCRSLSNALAVCSVPISILLARGASAEPAGDVILRAPVARRGKNPVGVVELDQFAEIHEGGLVRDPCRLLHIVRDDGDGVILRQFLDQLLDLGGRDRVQRRTGLVEQYHFRAHRD